jgi:hypothetical protein
VISCLSAHPHSKRAIIPIPFNSVGSETVDWNDAGQTKVKSKINLVLFTKVKSEINLVLFTKVKSEVNLVLFTKVKSEVNLVLFTKVKSVANLVLFGQVSLRTAFLKG